MRLLTATYLLDWRQPGCNLITKWYRDLTMVEGKDLLFGDVVYCVRPPNLVVQYKVNSTPQVWVQSGGVRMTLLFTKRETLIVGNKYGADLDPISTDFQTRVVVPVKKIFTKEESIEVVTAWVVNNELQSNRN